MKAVENWGKGKDIEKEIIAAWMDEKTHHNEDWISDRFTVQVDKISLEGRSIIIIKPRP